MQVITLLYPFLLMLGNSSLPQPSQNVQVDIDWPTFMARHDLVWDELPARWQEGPFLGNGKLGVMIYQKDEHHIRLDVGSSEVQDHRGEEYGYVMFAEPRLPIGHFTLQTAGKIQSGTMRLDLYNAEVRGTVVTDRGHIEIQALIHSEEMAILVSMKPADGELPCQWEFHPDLAISPRQNFGLKYHEPYRTQPDYPMNPDPVLEEEKDIHFCVQFLLGGGQTVTAWRQIGQSDREIFYATVAHSFPENTARSAAFHTIQDVSAASWRKLLTSHQNWWHRFYSASFVSLPDQRLESFYWIQIYKLGSATRSDCPVMDNTGPWLQETPWPGLWWDLNVQVCYGPVYTANHLELGESLVNAFYRNQNQLIENAPLEYQSDSAYLGLTTSQTFRMRYETMKRDLAKFHPFLGGLPWACHNLWLHYRYSMDESLLKELVYPVLRRSMNLYLHFLQEGDDGRLHLPDTHSPEYGNAEDCNFDLALLRWGCQTLIQISDRLHISDPLRGRWQDIVNRLVAFPADETGLMVGRGVPFTRSHRHYSHLLAIYPLYLVNWEQLGNRTLIETSLRQWLRFDGALQGWSYTAAASLGAHMGKGDEAVRYLNVLLDRFVFPNTMYMEHGPVIETPITVNQSIHDMLLTSWGDKIRVFPAVPSSWNDLTIHNLRAEGAFLVSAVRKNGITCFVRIRSLAGEPCTIQADLPPPIQVVTEKPASLKEIGEHTYSLDLEKGQEVILVPSQTKTEIVIRPLPGEAERYNYYGRKSSGVQIREIVY